MIEKLKNLTDNQWIYNYWKEAAQLLEKKDISINVADFDYTLFSRDEQLNNEQYLRENRGDLGPKAICDNGGINAFVEKYYSNRTLPSEILKQIDTEKDLIITAGVYEFQVAKLIACGLDTYNYVITPSGKEKILELIRYVLYKLKYIPSQITIYEDRPEYFIEYKDVLEDVLGCKIVIMYVEMDGNDGYKKIEEI